jgi:hypothetical protein
MTKHTLDIYRHLYNNLPPLFPPELAEEIKQAIENYEQAEEINLEELERQMIDHGFAIWPYHQAHKEFFNRAIDDVGSHYLEPHLDDDLQKKYREYKEHGGDWHGLYSGRAAEYFEHDERVNMTKALIEARKKIKDYVRHDVLSLNQDKYLGRVTKYNKILRDIKSELKDLRAMAEKEDHDDLTSLIEAKIEDIEHSFSHLGRELQYHEVFNAVEFFRGRKDELNRLRGIDVPREIDFYNSDYND